MYDVSSNLNKFYSSNVVLPAKIQNELRDKRKLNIRRLESGLEEYNQENNTAYNICENRVQGSIAMFTVVQNDENDYDIDVAIVFEKENLSDLGPLATRNIVANALRKKTKQFNIEPEVKTSCVRIKYEDGYHVDFAIYRRYKESETDSNYNYEHAGNEWSKRDIRALDDWFKDQLDEKGKDLRKVIRLSKMFCKSCNHWKNTPSGLIQTVINSEQYTYESRIDKTFYNTMKNIIARLEHSIEVNAPVDNNRKLVTREIDKTRVTNWKNRLEEKIEILDILFNDKCTDKQALTAWGSFFNHEYWTEQIGQIENKSSSSSYSFTDTEEFIEDMYLVNDVYEVYIKCEVTGNGFPLMAIKKYIDNFTNKIKRFIPHNFSVRCSIGRTNAPSYDKILWKVKNVGQKAEKRNQVRGQIEDRGSKISENTQFVGPHYIECYLIKNNICIGIGHVSVPIGEA